MFNNSLSYSNRFIKILQSFFSLKIFLSGIYYNLYNHIKKFSLKMNFSENETSHVRNNNSFCFYFFSIQ